MNNGGAATARLATENGVNASKAVNASPTSLAIEALRFPLTLAVLFIHLNPETVSLPEADFSLLSGQGLFNILCILLSHTICQIAVPTFFVISGYLFFANMPRWSWDGYRSKLRSRWHSLVIPYLIWNALPWIEYVIAYAAKGYFLDHSFDELIAYVSEKNINIFTHAIKLGSERTNWLGIALESSWPLNIPLWYLRDLIVMCLLTPIIYWAVRHVPFICLTLFGLAHVSQIWTTLPGLSCTAFFFFSIGAAFAVHGVEIVTWTRRFKWAILPISAITMVGTAIYNGHNTQIGESFRLFWVIAGMFSAFIIADEVIRRKRYTPSKRLTASCFFIYAAHNFPIPLAGSPLVLCATLLHAVIPGETLAEDFLCYVTAPALAAFALVVIYRVGMRHTPKVMRVLAGGR